MEEKASAVRVLGGVLFVASLFVVMANASTAHAAGPACKRFRDIAADGALRCTHADASITGPDAAERLFAAIDARIKAGEFEHADTGLACASVRSAGGDWQTRYETVRRYGVLDYRQERVPEALQAFECALEITEQHRFRPGIAKQLKNIGAARLRLGDFEGAQQSLERSLSMQRADGSADIGSVLNNLGDLYREQNDHERALRYYREAIDHYRRSGNDVEAAHTMETMSLMALDRGDTKAAIALLTRAMRDFRQQGHRPYRLRVYAGLARAALQEGDLGAARRWCAEGLAFATRYRLVSPPILQLQTARVERADGHAPAAIATLSRTLATLPDGDPQRIALLEERAMALADVGALPEALAALREAKEAERLDAQARFDQRIAWQRSRLEAVERERRIATLEAERRQRRLWAGVAALIALAVVLIAGLLALRRGQRAREQATARQARYEEALQRYRSEAEALRIDRRLLRALLATRDGAVCLLDGDGHVLAANPAACTLLGVDECLLLGMAFGDRIDPADRMRWTQAVYDIEEGRSDALRVAGTAGPILDARIIQWQEDAGVLILTLQAATPGTLSTLDPHAPEDSDRATTTASTVMTDLTDTLSDAEEDAEKRYRRTLVELMLATIEHWERSTGTNRIELAERSRIWRIGIDDGRLRARAMERYLTLSQLPRRPRWRDVLRTVYFVLGHCALDADARDRLQRGVDDVLAHCRRGAYEA